MFTIIEKEYMGTRCGKDLYSVTIDRWERNDKNTRDLLNACDRCNFGGTVQYDGTTENGYIILWVSVWVD